MAKVDIGYAKAAKRVDVKRVKSCMWSILTKPEQAPNQFRFMAVLMKSDSQSCTYEI